MIIFAEGSFDPTNDIDPEKKIVDLHMFDGSSVCRKAQKTMMVVYPMLACVVGKEHTCRNVFKGWAFIEEITKLCREDKVC